ncbi:MAG: hypothetical protein LBR70_05500 [Lactobacillaceae bacterium]|jgi:hypothetical protein|nr:hypothetical protein [Lactobacillaceae bacterium]
MIKFLFVSFFSFVLCGSAFAQVADYTRLFDIDLEEKLPPIEELREKYINPNQDFDRKYDYHWNIGNVFDEVFKATIVSYGSSTKRIPHEEEKNLERVLNVIPKEYWEYIGPYLHTVPGIPEKILNMPGIKETKNRFPTRIARELEDIEDIEFLSPYLYFMLMPEAWPSYRETEEIPRKRFLSNPGKTKYDPEFFNKIKELVPEENYYPGSGISQSLKSRLRTINPTKDSPLTSADVKAFVSTIYDVEKFGEEDYNVLKISEAGSLLEAWEIDNGKGLPVQALKAVVNPCQRLAQKIRLAGLEYKFLKVIGKQGFDLNSWAYTCDKTFKAYRVASLNSKYIPSIMNYQRKVYEKEVQMLDDESAQQQYATMQSIAEMYKAPIEDVLEVRSSGDELRKEILKIQETLIDSPVIMNY